jgi:hypothetical protein
MGRVRRRALSPAMVVAIVALVFAVAGSAVATVATVSVLSKKEKKQTRKIAKEEINKAAPGLSVANAGVADKLDGLDSTAFPRIVAADTLTIDPPPVSPAGCLFEKFTGGSFSAIQSGNVALLFPSGALFLTAEGLIQNTAGELHFYLCNLGSTPVDEPVLDLRVIVLH